MRSAVFIGCAQRFLCTLLPKYMNMFLYSSGSRCHRDSLLLYVCYVIGYELSLPEVWGRNTTSSAYEFKYVITIKCMLQLFLIVH